VGNADASRPRVLRREDIGHLAVGAALLGSGGGGAPDVFVSILKRRLAGREVNLFAPEELSGATTVPVGMVGGTSVLVEKLPGGGEFGRAVEAVCRWSDTRAQSIMGIEIGGMNALTGLYTAIDLDLPYLDADLMGRALPRMDQFTWAAANLPVCPMALCQANGQTLLIDHSGPEELERAVRTFVAMLGGWAAAAARPTEARTAAGSANVGGVARALALGRAHAALPAKPSRAEVADALGASVLGAGRIRQVHRRSHSIGFGRGRFTFVDECDGTVLRVEAENELLLALADGEVVATCPDILCVLQARTAQPLAADQVQMGDDVILVVLHGPEWWMDPSRIHRVAPRAFGLESEPVVGSPP
jgi:DUF917 family protein